MPVKLKTIDYVFYALMLLWALVVLGVGAGAVIEESREVPRCQ